MSKTIEELEEIVDELTSKVKKLQDNLSLARMQFGSCLERLEEEVESARHITGAVKELQYELTNMFPELFLIRGC